MFGRPHTDLLGPLGDADFDWVVVHFTPYALTGYSAGLASLLAQLRKLRPQAVVLGAELYAGGMHRLPPDPDRLQQLYPELHAFVALEGEVTIPALVAAGRPRRFFHRGVPAPARLLDALAPYLWTEEQVAGLKSFLGQVGSLPKNRLYQVGPGTLPIYFSRGCPYSCSFCSNPYPTYRAMNREGLEAHLRWALANGFDHLFVLDDAANVRPDFGDLLALAESGGFTLDFPNGLRADQLCEEHVEALAGLTDKLTISAESAVPRLQEETIGKRVSVEDVERVVAWCSRAGLSTWVHWMVGLPGEHREDTLATLATARRLLDEHGARPLLQYATPLPGTAMGGENPEPGNSLGIRMQHRPTYQPRGVEPRELEAAVGLLRRRTREAETAKVIVNVTYRCNNHCVFCAVGNRVKEDLPATHVIEVLERYHREGVHQVDFDGGEPTLHPHFMDLIRHAAGLGYRPINVTTNGRRLAYAEFARKLFSAGITGLLISIHGPTAAIHDAVTGVPGSFGETLQGIRNARALAPADLDLGVNTTLSVDNLGGLERLVELMAGCGVEKLNIQFLTPFGRAPAATVPEVKAAAGVVRDVVGRWRDRMGFQIINLPYCYLPGLEELVAQDLGKLSRNMVFVTGEEVNLAHYLAGARRYDDNCRECLLRVGCDGRYDFSEVFD